MSELANRVTKSGQTHSMELIFFPLFILIIVGIVANEYSSSGIETTPTLPGPPPQYCQQIAICFPLNTTGCDVNVQNCNLTATTTFSFLNSNSPYALLLSGNILGFFNCLLGCTQIAPISNLISLNNCTNVRDGNSSNFGEFITFFYCTGASFNSPAVTLFPPYNATSATGNNSNWFIQGSPSVGKAGQNLYVYASYLKNGSTYQNKYCDAVGICYHSPGTTCATVVNHHFNTQYCLYYILANTAAPNFSSTFTIFAFIAGIVLLLLGLGLTIAFQVLSTGSTVGVNEQATKMAQVFGLGLLSWSFIYSEFGFWLSNLPFNLSTIGFLSFTAMFFLGLYWRLFTLD